MRTLRDMDAVMLALVIRTQNGCFIFSLGPDSTSEGVPGVLVDYIMVSSKEKLGILER